VTLGWPDLVATSLERDAEAGGVRFTYQVVNDPFPADANAALFWASGPSLSNRIGSPIVEVPVQRAMGTHGPILVTAAALGTPPEGASHLVLALDPENRHVEFDETNNSLAILVHDVEALSLDVDFQSLVGQILYDRLFGGVIKRELDLRGTAEVRNSGLSATGPFDVVFYASENGEYSSAALELGPAIHVASLAPGESVEVVGEFLTNPVLTTRFSDGFFIGVRLDPANHSHDGRADNNSRTIDGCDFAPHYATILTGVAALMFNFDPLGTPDARNHLLHYLDGTGTPIDHGPDSDAAQSARVTEVFKDMEKNAANEVNNLLFANRRNSAPGQQYKESLSLTVIKPYWGIGPGSDLDLAFAFGGTKISQGEFTGTSFIDVVDGRRILDFAGTLRFTFRDRYEFDNDDVFKTPFDYIGRLLEHCGLARVFDSSLTIEIPLNGRIDRGPADPPLGFAPLDVHPWSDLYGPGPAPDANTAYVRSLYHTVLGRDGEDSGIAYWFGLLQSGVGHDVVAWAFVNSTEHRRQQVDAMYRAYLGRGATDPLSEYWVGLLQAHGDEAAVAAGILASAEYAASHADADAFLHALYIQVLGRQQDEDGAAFWKVQLAAGVSRESVAAGFIRSREASELATESLYSALLHRAGDPLREYWIGSLAGRSLTLGEVFVGFLDSQEFRTLRPPA
jgi:hypothetical protein